MKDNVIEKYYEYRVKNIVKYVTILLENSFKEKFKWNKELSQCTEFYFKNHILINGFNSKLQMKYRRFFDKNNLTDINFQTILISIFETLIDFKEIKDLNQEKVALMIAKCFDIAILIDQKINFSLNLNVLIKEVYDSISDNLSSDEKFNELWLKSKHKIQPLIKKNIALKSKFIKLLLDDDFQIEFIPLINSPNEKTACEVITKYSIPDLSKYQPKEIEYVLDRDDLDIELVYITYTLLCTFIIKMVDKKNSLFYMINLNNKFFIKKTYLNNLIKLISKHGYNNQIILEFDAKNLKKASNVKIIEKIRSMGVLISVYNPDLELDQNSIDFINIKDDQSKKKDLFKKYGKNGKVLIISDTKEEEFQRLISYHKGTTKKSMTELLE